MQERRGALPAAMGWERWQRKGRCGVQAPLVAGGARAAVAWATMGTPIRVAAHDRAPAGPTSPSRHGARTSSRRHAETRRRSGRACPRPRCPGGSCRSCFGAQRHLGGGVGVAVGSSNPARARSHGHSPGNEPRTTCWELRVPGECPQPGMLGAGTGASWHRGATQGTAALGGSPAMGPGCEVPPLAGVQSARAMDGTVHGDRLRYRTPACASPVALA